MTSWGSRTPNPLRRVGTLAIDSLVNLGTAVMMDFGLAGLFDRFEREFGKGAARLLLGLIGAAIVAACLHLIGSVVHPVVVWSTKTVLGSHVTWLTVRLITFVIVGGFVIVFFMLVSLLFDGKQAIAEAYRQLDDLGSVAEEQKEMQEDLLNLSFGIAYAYLEALDLAERCARDAEDSSALNQIATDRRKIQQFLAHISANHQRAADDNQLQLDIEA